MPAPMKLAIENHHPMDDSISFEESTHTYTIDGDTSFTSVTTFVHQHFPHFDADATIQSLLSEKKTYKGRTFQNNSKYRETAIKNIQIALHQFSLNMPPSGAEMNELDQLLCACSMRKSVKETGEDTSLERATALLNDTSSLYYIQQKNAIKSEWEKTSTSGTQMHLDIEYFYNDMPQENTSQEYAHFISFHNDFKMEFPHYRPYRTEWTVFYKELKLAGSVDMVFENTKDGTLMIYDWKRVKSIDYEAFDNRTAITPCLDGMPDSKFWHYSLQLNTYKAIIEAQYYKKVTKLVLVRLYPDAPSYELYECHDLQDEVKQLFENRRIELNK